MSTTTETAPVDIGASLHAKARELVTSARQLVEQHNLTGGLATAAPFTVLCQAVGLVIIEDSGANPEKALHAINLAAETIADSATVFLQAALQPAAGES